MSKKGPQREDLCDIGLTKRELPRGWVFALYIVGAMQAKKRSPKVEELNTPQRRGIASERRNASPRRRDTHWQKIDGSKFDAAPEVGNLAYYPRWAAIQLGITLALWGLVIAGSLLAFRWL